jgi:hypothetical protein
VSDAWAPLDTLPQALQDALGASDLLPFAEIRERAEAEAAGISYLWGPEMRGFYIARHGRPAHLWARGAPVVTAPIGQTPIALVPRGLAVPTDLSPARYELSGST